MRSSEIFFAVICVILLGVGGYFMLPSIMKEFSPEEIIRVRVTLENKCTLTDDAFVVLDEEKNIKTPFYGKVAVLYTRKDAPLRLWMSPNFPEYRYDGEIQRAEENMVMISDCDRNPRMDTIFKSMRDQFSSENSDQKN